MHNMANYMVQCIIVSLNIYGKNIEYLIFFNFAKSQIMEAETYCRSYLCAIASNFYQ